MHIKHLFLVFGVCFGLLSSLPADEALVVYSHRHYESDNKLFAAFTEQTRIEVRVVKAGASELLERLKTEGENTTADVLITADAGRLVDAKSAGLLAPVNSEFLNKRITDTYRDPEGHWFGFTLRSRVLVYNPERVSAGELSTYEALANPEWRARILCRSSANIYNQSLLASLIAANGEKEAANWARAVRKNMARPPQGSDRDQIRAVASGLGDVAIVNTYYVGLLLNSPDPKDRRVAKQVEIFFPNQEGRGAHVNVSGGGVLKASNQKENAVRFLEFLASDAAQKTFPSTTYEYPVVEGVDRSPLQASWGEFEADSLNVAELGRRKTQAVKLFNRAGWE